MMKSNMTTSTKTKRKTTMTIRLILATRNSMSPSLSKSK